jgi:hypothetical protein
MIRTNGHACKTAVEAWKLVVEACGLEVEAFKPVAVEACSLAASLVVLLLRKHILMSAELLLWFCSLLVSAHSCVCLSDQHS